MPTVLVTGAGRGLGLEFVRQYASEGWSVLAGVRDVSRCPELRALANAAAGARAPAGVAPARVEEHALDIADHASIDALAAKLHGRTIDVLLNNAGTMGNGSFAEQGLQFGKFGGSDFADWEHVLRINTLAPMKMAEAFVAHVAASEQKKIVSLTSVVGSIGKNTIGSLYAYRSSKAALNAVMRSLAIDLGRQYGIIAAPIHPGWARTDMGGPRADVDPAASVAGVRKVIAGLDTDRAGRFWMFDGSELPW